MSLTVVEVTDDVILPLKIRRYERTVGLKIGAHFYFVSLISQRVFNFRSPTIAYDNPQLQQIVISYSIFDGDHVIEV